MDPLAKLHDIQLPNAIPNYPLAIGWWLLLTLIIIGLWFSIKFFIRYRSLRKVKRQALRQLAKQPNMSNAELVALLKWACLHYFPRAQVAQLYGAQFQRLLMTSMPNKQQASFEQYCGASFNELYQASTSAEASLQAAAKLWLSTALPPSTDRYQQVSLLTETSNNGAKL